MWWTLFGFAVLLLIISTVNAEEIVTCDRRPLGTTAEPLPPDNRYMIEVEGLRENKYIPKHKYKVKLFGINESDKFIGFSISLQGDTRENKQNTRKPILLHAGTLEPFPDSINVMKHPICNNTVIQKDTMKKTYVEAEWTAPKKDMKCVMIFAMVADKPDTWYSYEGPLSKRICEDRRKIEDMQPVENDNCQVCEDAKYQLTFEGMWNDHTHLDMYPKAQAGRFSDVVGASHSMEKNVYKFNHEATPGLKMLAEQGNTSKLELEIQKDLGDSVRTVIKATAPPETDKSTIMSFRVTQRHHLVSLVTALLPSPDWFLGVANMELCDRSNRWAESRTLNLYPLDAGTDSGTTFEASNEETSPPKPIESAVIGKTKPDKPFAKLRFRLIRTYINPRNNCSSDTALTATTEGSDTDQAEDTEVKETSDNDRRVYERPSETPTTSEEPSYSESPRDTESTPDCAMSAWSEWGECQGECVDNTLTGYQAKMRRLLGKSTPECEKMSTVDWQVCSEPCEEQTEEESDQLEEEND